MQLSLNIPNADAAEALEAIEEVWKADAQRIFPGYDTASPQAQFRMCIAALIRVSVKNKRREAAERAINVQEPDVQ